MTTEQQSNWTFFGSILLVALIVGALSGVIAAVMTNQSIDRYTQTLSERMGFLSISEVKPRPLPGTYEESLERVQETGWPAYASILPASSDSAAASAWIRKEGAEGSGIVITNDGWILSHTSSLPNTTLTGYEVWIAGERYEVESVVEDTLTDFVLFKIDAQGLSSIAFGTSQEMDGGEIIFHIPGGQEITSSSVTSVGFAQRDVILPAEAFVHTWKTGCDAEEGPVLNSNGELVAFMSDASVAEPIHYALPFVESVLRTGEPQHAAIGAYTVDIATVLNVSEDIVDNVRAGALIQEGPRGMAVLRGSPAAESGLEEGDIILAVDGTSISVDTSFAELVAEYQPGDTAELTILRDGEEQSVQISFWEYSDLRY